jgi:ketohexokinase
VICVGNATLDIVNRVAGYPREDEEVRARSQTRTVGGNAANTATVLAQLGAAVAWVGNLGDPADVVAAHFARFGVDAAQARPQPGHVMPTSYVTLSLASGSRTIVHYRDLPEYRAGDFARVDLDGVDWLHFEGRAVDELALMLERARRHPGIAISLEIEKARPGIEALFGQADLLLFSHDYARSRGAGEATALLRSLPAGTVATCTWGAQGAWGIDGNGVLTHSPAPPLPVVVDTLGAGDVFNAGMIDAMRRGRAFVDAIAGAVELASAQCAVEGLALARQAAD